MGQATTLRPVPVAEVRRSVDTAPVDAGSQRPPCAPRVKLCFD